LILARGGADCNDTNVTLKLGAADTCGNGIDEDCSGSEAACIRGGMRG